MLDLNSQGVIPFMLTIKRDTVTVLAEQAAAAWKSPTIAPGERLGPVWLRRYDEHEARR